MNDLLNDGHELATGSYRNFRLAVDAFPDRDLVPVRISIGTPKWDLGYRLDEFCGTIAPYGVMGKKAAETVEGFERMYLARLNHKTAPHIAGRLKAIARRHGPGCVLVLMCYEDLSPRGMQREPVGNDCHRTTFAGWFGPKIGADIPELDVLVGPPVLAEPVPVP